MNTLTSADEIRSKILAQFEQFKPSLAAYHEYAGRISALAVEYHDARLKEFAPDAVSEEAVLVLMLDARETPKSLDEKLNALLQTGVKVKQIIFDRARTTYYIFA